MLVRNAIALLVVRRPHRAEFVQPKMPAETARPMLPKHNRKPDIESN